MDRGLINMNTKQLEQFAEHVSSKDLDWINDELKETEEMLYKYNKKHENLLDLRSIASEDLIK